jgi:hypothetical protein
MANMQLPGSGSGDEIDDDGYDESQRAEILEATRDGPSDGLILTDLNPDLGDVGDDDTDPEDDLKMEDDEVGEESTEATLSEEDADEDEAQDDFDDGDTEEEGALKDTDDAALRP